MLPRKMFENLHALTATLVLFKQFLGENWPHFWPLTLSALPNMMHFVRSVSTNVLKATMAYYYEEIQNHGKILFIHNTVENGWWGMHTQHTPHSPLCFELKIPKAGIKHGCCKEVNGMLSDGTGKAIFNVSDFVFLFELQHVDHFCLKLLAFFLRKT